LLDILRPGTIEGGLAYDKGRVVAVSHRQVRGDVVAWAIGARGVSVHLAALAGARFAIDSVTREACLDGVELRLTDQTFEFLLLLTRTPRIVVSTEAVNDVIGRQRKDSDAAKKAKSTLLARIRAAFKEAGLEPPSDLEELVTSGARGGYCLCVSAYVR
jgi:DNA-binding response OmpR family regulator